MSLKLVSKILRPLHKALKNRLNERLIKNVPEYRDRYNSSDEAVHGPHRAMVVKDKLVAMELHKSLKDYENRRKDIPA